MQHLQKQNMRGFWLARMCVSQHNVHPAVKKKSLAEVSRSLSLSPSLSLRKFQNLII